MRDIRRFLQALGPDFCFNRAPLWSPELMSSDAPGKSELSERNICTKFITPAHVAAGWDLQTQIREEVGFTAGRVTVQGSRG